MRIEYLIFFSLLFFITPTTNAQNTITAKEYKKIGIEYLSQGQTDSALIFLYQAENLGLVDGELMGSLALAHLQKQEINKALKWAKLSLADKVNPSPDGWLAGALAYDQQGRAKKRDLWFKKGIQQFPTDYLLRFYSAQTSFHKNPAKAEANLLAAIYLQPVYAPAHLLLGQEMHKQNQNTKTLLPFLYYLILYHDAPESPEIVDLIENTLNNWALSPATTNNTSMLKSDALIPPFQPTPNSNLSKDEWLIHQLTQLMKSLGNKEFIHQNPSWAYYIDFFSDAFKQGHSQALIHHLIFSRYKAETIEWITKYSEQYEMMALWVSIWDFGR